MDDARWHALRALRDDEASGVPLLLARARGVRDGGFPLFSRGVVPIGVPGAWRRDPILGRAAPQRFYADVPYLDPEEVGDSKFVWEPSRFAAGVWLGVAHALEADPAYWKRFVGLVTSWIDENPYPLGVHYCSALEVGLRAYAWVWSLALFRKELAEEPALLRSLLDGVWNACHHVEANLSRYFSPNTHLTGEALALFACGAALPEFVEAARWRRIGSEVLSTEASRQVHADGTHRELSSGYHLYSCDFYLHAALIAHETGLPIDPEVPRAARHLCLRLADLVPADGVLPQWNDCDGGKLLSLGEAALDARPTLSAARAAFAEDAQGGAFDLAAGAGAGEHPPGSTPCGYALLMKPATPVVIGASNGPRVPVVGAQPDRGALPDSGIATYRNAAGDYLVFRASPFGYLDCPHSHDAALSLILYLAGRPLIVDNGTGSYTQDRALRDRFRGAAGKSVLTFDGMGPSLPGDTFGWRTTTDAHLEAAECDGRGGFRCAGSYDTTRGAAPGERLHVEREVALIAESHCLEITDRWRGNAGARVETRFTIAPQIEIDVRADRMTIPGLGDVSVSCESPGGEPDPERRVERVLYSADYGSIGETNALIFELGRAASGSCLTRFALPTPAAAERLE